MTARTLLPLCLISIVSFEIFASAPAKTLPKPVSERREHYVLRDAGGSVPYEITEISMLADDLHQNFVLVRDPDHGSFLLIRRSSYAEGEVSYALTDVRQKDYIRTSFAMPTAGKTFAEALAEGKRHPELLMVPVILKLATNGGEWADVSTEWEEWSKLRALRHSVRQTVPFYLLEALERMRGAVLTVSAGQYFYNLIGRLVLYDTQEEPQLRLQKVEQAPACDFDKSLGYPCSAAQLKRIKTAQDSGKPLSSY
jgi:hypothetical protein